jgi:hypothetical protein
MFDRIVGVFRLDKNVFESIEHDLNATSQAALVVLLVALLNGLSNIFTSRQNFFGGFITSVIWAFVGWILWAAITYFVGTRFFGGQADLSEMLRVTGFAQAPLMLGIIPCIGGIVGALWALAAMFIAVRQGLDIDDSKTLITVLIGFAVYVIGWISIAIFLGITAFFGRVLTGG